MTHLKDFVYMRRGSEEPVQVPADMEALSEKMAAGYEQCDPPSTTTTKEKK